MNFYSVLERLSTSVNEHYMTEFYQIGYEQYDRRLTTNHNLLVSMINDDVRNELTHDIALREKVIHQIFKLKSLSDVLRYVRDVITVDCCYEDILQTYLASSFRGGSSLSSLLFDKSKLSQLIQTYSSLTNEHKNYIIRSISTTREELLYDDAPDKYFYMMHENKDVTLALSSALIPYPEFCFNVFFKDASFNMSLYKETISQLEESWTGPEGRKIMLAFAGSTSSTAEEEAWKNRYHLLGFEAAERAQNPVLSEIDLHM